MKTLQIFVVLCLTLVLGELIPIELDEQGNFVDPHNRKILFHGFNNVKKKIPFYDESMLNSTSVRMLWDRGFNLVRLGIIWGAAHLGPQQFNETYFEKMKEIVDALGEQKFYVIIDMHQDGLSSRYGTYDGMPGWIIDRFPAVPWIFSFPWPLREKPAGEYWFKSYLTYECQNSFQSLYDNVENALDLWKEFWVKTAETFKGKPHVLGYELMNEPFAGNIFTNPLRLLPGYAGKYNLLPAYDRLVDAIRKVDNKTLIFYEPVTWGVFTSATNVFSTGFERLPGSDLELAARKSVLSYHYYCWLLQTADPSIDFPKWKQDICDSYLMKEVFKSSEESVKQSGGGRMLTEFGLCEPDGNEKSVNTIECQLVMNKADEAFQSWTYWDSIFFNSKGEIKETPMKSFSRCYPIATLGDYELLNFDVNTGECNFKFKLGTVKDQDLAVLELFIPGLSHYPKGYEVSMEPDHFKWEEISGPNHVIGVYAKGEYKPGDMVTITVKAK